MQKSFIDFIAKENQKWLKKLQKYAIIGIKIKYNITKEDKYVNHS